jgi:thiosulfate/3-mercaptopyruvate sulfurtransferase
MSLAHLHLERRSVRTALAICGATLALAVTTVLADATTRRSPDATPMLVSTQWLADHLSEGDLVVVALGMDSSAIAAEHVPGARYLSYGAITRTRNGVDTELPEASALVTALQTVGISTTSHVVIYAEHLPMATRAYFTMDYLGLPRVSLLDGGLPKWKAEHRATTNKPAKVTPGIIQPHPRPDDVASAAWVREHLGQPGIALIDTRMDEEYEGRGERHGMPSNGHLHAAKQLEWETLTEPQGSLQFKPIADLRRLYEQRAASSDTVVTYCLVGYRASATYFVARLLGYHTKLYDGSYQEWDKLGYPVEAGRDSSGHRDD